MNMVLRGRPDSARRVFIEITPELRMLLERIAASAIDALDAIDGDADEEDGGDAEPSFGWAASEARQGARPQPLDEAEDDGDREPSLGWCRQDRGDQFGGDDDREDDEADSEADPAEDGIADADALDLVAGRFA